MTAAFMRASLCATASLLLAASASAQDATARVDSIFSFATPETPGCAVGVSQRGRVLVNKAYGLADLERKRPLDQRSRFDIGSLQKQFTAASMLLLAEQGRLSLSDDIRKHLPELPDYGHTVTVNHLLTHTSGMRDWTGILPMAPEGTEALPLIMRQRGLNFVPGTEWSYSNSGYELAKEIVARVSGMSFAEFTRRNLFEPLGMRSTAYVPDILHAGEDAAIGYQKDGTGWTRYMRLGNNRAGGAIASTVGDLLIWTQALESGRLGKAVTDGLHEQTRLSNGRKLMYARGLIVDSTPGGLVVSHSGGAAGYSNWLGRVPEHGLSVAVSCNFDPASATALSGRVADLFLPPLDPATVPAGPVAAQGVDVSGRAGIYFEERTGEPLRLAVNSGRLTIANGPPLVPVSAERFRPPRPSPFFRSQDDFELVFPDPDRIEIRSMEGEVTRYRRARAWTPVAGDLEALGGRYESPELGNTFEIVPGAGAITLRDASAPEKSVELTPVERDAFMLRMMIVRFTRDASGRVTGFEYSNPVAKRIRFRRLEDRGGATAAAAGPAARETTAARATTSGTPAAARPAASPASPSGSTPGAPKLDVLVGEYELAPGRALTITLEGGQLHGQPPNSDKRALSHVSGMTFSVAGSSMTLTFTIDANGRATGIVMQQEGRERNLTRVR